MRSRSWPRSARGRARPPGEEGHSPLDSNPHPHPDHRSGSPRAAAPARQRGPSLRFTARAPSTRPFVQGWAASRPPAAALPPRPRRGRRAVREAGPANTVEYSPRSAWPLTPPPSPAGAGRRGLGEGSRGEVPSAGRATAPPAPPGRRGTGSWRPPGRRRRSGASEPTPTAGGARPRPRRRRGQPSRSMRTAPPAPCGA